MSKPTVLGYMREQPERLAYVFDNRDVFVKPFVEMFKKHNIKKVIFFGSGTSYNVSHLATYYFKHLVNVAAEAQYPTVFVNYEKADWTNTLKEEEILFVGISQSGTSRSTIEIMKHATEKGYHTLVITGNLESEITKHVETKTHLLVGDELTPPETKGYTVSVLSVYLWALECAKELSSLIKNLNCYVNLIPYNETENIGFKRTKKMQILAFYDILKKNGINVTIRKEFGSKVDAACGQLRANQN